MRSVVADIARLRREWKRARRVLNSHPPSPPDGWHVREVARLERTLDEALRAEGHRRTWAGARYPQEVIADYEDLYPSARIEVLEHILASDDLGKVLDKLRGQVARLAKVVDQIAEVSVPVLSDDLSPAEVRAIRKRLGLTQKEAGALLGGGPSAFTKYEAGSHKPAASMVNLLRLLNSWPDLMDTLRREGK